MECERSAGEGLAELATTTTLDRQLHRRYRFFRGGIRKQRDAPSRLSLGNSDLAPDYASNADLSLGGVLGWQ